MMDLGNCPDCWKEQRSINDMFQQAIIDGQKLANEQKKKVAVIQEGFSYRIQCFLDSIPPGSLKVIDPLQ